MNAKEVNKEEAKGADEPRSAQDAQSGQGQTEKEILAQMWEEILSTDVLDYNEKLNILEKYGITEFESDEDGDLQVTFKGKIYYLIADEQGHFNPNTDIREIEEGGD